MSKDIREHYFAHHTLNPTNPSQKVEVCFESKWKKDLDISSIFQALEKLNQTLPNGLKDRRFEILQDKEGYYLQGQNNKIRLKKSQSSQTIDSIVEELTSSEDIHIELDTPSNQTDEKFNEHLKTAEDKLSQSKNKSYRLKMRLGMSVASTIASRSPKNSSVKSIFRQGGTAFQASEIELSTLEKLLQKENTDLSPLDLEEKKKAQDYFSSLKNSEDINKVIYLLSNSYEPDQVSELLDAISFQIVKRSQGLEVDQMLNLDFGHENHAMRLCIRKEKDHFKLTLYDSSGGAERTHMLSNIRGSFKLAFIESQLKKGHSQRHTGLEISIPREKMEKDGKEYFKKLYHIYSGQGKEEERKFKTHLSQDLSLTWEYKLKHPILALQASLYSTNLMAINRDLTAKRHKWKKTLQTFATIAEDKNPPKLLKLTQRPQVTANCFAKRVQCSQMHYFGKTTYKKVRKELIIEQKKELLEDLYKEHDPDNIMSFEEKRQLQTMPMETLSPAQLKKLCQTVSDLRDTPSPSYFREEFKDDEKKENALKKFKQYLQEHPDEAKYKNARNLLEKGLEIPTEDLVK